MAYRRDVDPTASAAALYAHKLRKLRDAKGWTQDSLAGRVGCTGDLISKIETAKRAATMEMSRHFDRLFELDDYFADLQPLAAREFALGWFRPFLDAEAAATSLHVFEPTLITGLLQTEEYARVVLSAGNHPERLEQLIATRMARQEILRRDDPPWLVVLLTEYAVRRTVGSADIMRRQLERLLEVTREPHITIQIVPEDAPVYFAGVFALMSFAGRANAAYVETPPNQGEVIDRPQLVNELEVRWDIIRAAALPAAASEKVISSILESV